MIWLGCNPSWRNLFQQSSTFKPSKGRTAGLGFPASCVWLLERWPTSSWSMDVQHMPVNNQGIIQRKYGMYLVKYCMFFNYRVSRWVDLGWPKQDIHIIYIYICVCFNNLYGTYPEIHAMSWWLWSPETDAFLCTWRWSLRPWGLRIPRLREVLPLEEALIIWEHVDI